MTKLIFEMTMDKMGIKFYHNGNYIFHMVATDVSNLSNFILEKAKIEDFEIHKSRFEMNKYIITGKYINKESN